MKRRRVLSALLCAALLLGTAPLALGAEAEPKVTWYPQAETVTRLYGSDRMILVKDGLCALYGLDGTGYSGFFYDAIGEVTGNGQFPAAKNGAWGRIDPQGVTVIDFLYGTQEEAANAPAAKFVSQWADNSPPYAVAALEGHLLTDYIYWATTPFENGFAMVSTGKAWGFVDETGRAITEEKYRGIGDVKMGSDLFWGDGYAIVHHYEGVAYNIIDREGRELLAEPSRRKPWRAGHGLFGFTTGYYGEVGFVDGEGNVVIEPQYAYKTNIKGFMTGNVFNNYGAATVYLEDGSMTQITLPGGVGEDGLHEGLRRVQDSATGRWGFENEAGELVVPYLYDAVGYFDHGYASVLLDGVYGLLENPLTREGEVTDPLAGFEIAWVDTENTLSLLEKDQLVVEYDILGRGGMMGHATWGDYGLRNADGELIVPVQYGTTLPGGLLGNGYFAVGEVDGVYTDYLGNTFTDEDMRTPWNPPELDTYREPGPDGMLESGKWGYADPWTGEKVLPAIYDEAYSFAHGLGIVRVGDDRYAIDRTGAKVIDLNGYSETGIRFVNTYLRVKDKESGTWSFLNTMGDLIAAPHWESTGDFSEDGLAAVCREGKWGFIDRMGNEVVPCVLDDISDAKDGLAVVTYRGTQGILKLPEWKGKNSNWALEELAKARITGLVTPDCETYQTFTITRRQFASLAVNWLEKATGEVIEPANENTFTDTSEEVILKAYAAGIVQGVGDGRFDPDGLLTREQLATMLWRAMEGAGIFIERPADLTEYNDGPQVAEWAREALSSLVAMGVMEGTGGNNLSPKASCTVEEAILMVWRGAGGPI